MKTIIAVLLAIILGGCASNAVEPRTVVFSVGGENVQVIDGTQKHPCEGNWNFCDHVMSLETLVIPGEDDEYGSYVYPEFKSHFMVHESEVKKWK